MKRLGSVAGTQNIDRILRLPGTTNLPNKKKIKAGRVACRTRLISFNDLKYSLDAFPAPEPSGKGRKAGAGIDTLPISKRMKDLIRGIDDPDHPYASRSEAVFAVIVAMVGAGCADNQIETVFLDTNYAISAHVLEQSKPPEYLARQIARAREIATDPHVAKLNENYALVIVGDKSAILKTTDDGIKFLTLQAFATVARQSVRLRQRKQEGAAGDALDASSAAPTVRGHRICARTRCAEPLQPVARLCSRTQAGGLLEVSRAPERQRLQRRRRIVQMGGRMVRQHLSAPRTEDGDLARAARQDGHWQDQSW